MFNHHRGLWGYTGAGPDGRPLTIQSTGMGGPSAAIVLSELIALGARRAIRVGTCGALAPALELGELVIARESICADGTSRALGASERASADPALTEALIREAPSAHAGTIVSVDLFYDTRRRDDPDGVWRADGYDASGRTLNSSTSDDSGTKGAVQMSAQPDPSIRTTHSTSRRSRTTTWTN